MRFVLQEYLSSLKEDKELDSFAIELLKSMGFIPMTKIQRGRQFGVDIAAVGTDSDKIRKLFLLVIKQGNLSRTNWANGNINDVRPSIIEILDIYLNSHVPKPYNELPVKIIVFCNGELEQTVMPNWTGFVREHTKSNLEFDFWGIHRLVDFCQRYQMQEEIFPNDLALNFRRALSFIDLPDYNLSHFTKFLKSLLPDKEPMPLTDKQVYKKLRLVNLCMSIVQEWCKKSNNLKPSYIASEHIILFTYNWISSNDFMNKRNTWVTYFSILQNWRTHNHAYVEKIYEHILIKDGLSFGIPSNDEYCLITFEQIGILSVLGLYELWESSVGNLHNDEEVILVSQTAFKTAESIANLIAHLIANNPSALNPKYDEHCIEINMGFILLYEAGLFGALIPWLRKLIDRVIINVRMAKFLPIFHSDPEKLHTEKAANQSSSHLLIILAEWCLILKQHNYYLVLKTFIESDLPHINLQMWFPDRDTEENLYKQEASHLSGATMTGIKLPENSLILEMSIKEESILLNEEKEFKCYTQLFNFMPFLSSRHFRTYPFPNSWRTHLSSRFCFSEQ